MARLKTKCKGFTVKLVLVRDYGHDLNKGNWKQYIFRRFCIIDVVLLVVQPLNMFFFLGGGVGLVIFNLHIRVGTRSCVL